MSMFEVGGGATGAVLLLKGLEFGIAYLRGRKVRSTPPSEMKISVPARSYSPGQMAAVTAERIAAAQTAREELVDRIETNNLLKRIADGVENLTESIGALGERMREDLKTTRHAIRSDIQTVRIEMSGICRVPGPPLPQQQRGRLPSRPGTGGE
jgi:hypothetical protein